MRSNVMQSGRRAQGSWGHCAGRGLRGAPWCAAYRNGSTNCGFYTYDQCMASVSGIGGYCNRNYIDGVPDKPAARKERVTEPKPKRKEEKERAAPAQKPVSPPAAAQPAPPPPPPAATVQPQPPPVAVQPAPPAAVQPTTSTAQQQASFGSARALILSGEILKPASKP